MDSVRLDVTYDASVAYLKVLRAKTIERIYRENLKLTEANLERAQIKVATGAAGPDEVYRWEAKYANDRKEVLYRESDTMDAMEALNRILHRPLQELFVPEEASLKDPLFIIGDKFFYQLMEKPWYMKKFREFAAKRALELRPELKGYDAAIKAKERLKTAARRQIWLPDFTVEWKVDQYFAEDGEGRRDSHLSDLDDTDWTVGVFARIPLFEGGKRVAQASRLQEEVSRLRINRSAKAEAIIQNVLASLNRTRASYPSITLSRQAAEAAKRNLDLVIDLYVQGIKTIIDLLDAQSQALSADLDAANAVYNFLIDFMGVERAIGEFVIFMPEDQRQEWFNRVYDALGLQKGKVPGVK
jgi:outer membrane protein TolC